YAAAKEFFQKAIALDPNFAGGYIGLAHARHIEARLYQRRSLAEVQDAAETLARRALALDSTDPQAHACLGLMLMNRGDYSGALEEINRALAMSPNLAEVHLARASVSVHSGRPGDALTDLDICIRLDPHGPGLAVALNQKAIAFYYMGDYESAVEA